MTYAEKLKDPRWQKKRLEIFYRDEFMCRDCLNEKKTLHVHHLDYIKYADPWDYPNEYLITLCEDCHENITTERPTFEIDIIKNFRLKAKTSFDQHAFAYVFHSYDRLNDLFYYLFMLESEHQETIIDYLQELFEIKMTKLKGSFPVLPQSSEMEEDK